MDIPVSNSVGFEKGNVGALPDKLRDITNPSSQEILTAIFPTTNTFKKPFPDISGPRYSEHVRDINATDSRCRNRSNGAAFNGGFELIGFPLADLKYSTP